jgi:hypothetical protein
MTERMQQLLATMLLCACTAMPACSGGGSAPRPAQPAPEPAELVEGDLRIRASAVPTMQLPESVARGYGIERGENRALLLVGLRRGSDGDEASLSGAVDARVTDLQGRTQTIAMRELHSGDPSAGPGQDLVDYIGIIVVTPPETLRFALRVTPTGEPPRELDFVREFYP